MKLKERARSTDFDVFLDGSGTMGELMRQKDWTATPLGSPDRWPQSLKTVLRVMLESRYAMWIVWGDQLTFFYNDACRYRLGAKHPEALGTPARQVWWEIWPDIGSRIEAVFDQGEATSSDGLMLLLDRSGFEEETYQTFSYSPLYRDTGEFDARDTGEVAGVLCVVTDDTERVILERRLALLRALATRLADTASEVDVVRGIAEVLSVQSLDIPWSVTCLCEPESMNGRLACCTGIAPEHVAAAAARTPQTSWRITEVLEHVTPQVIEELPSRFAELPAGPWAMPPTRALVQPIARGNQRAAGVFIAALNPYRVLDEAYRSFLELWAGLIASALANVATRKRALNADITGHKQADPALADGEAQFHQMADRSPMMVWTSAPNGECTYLSLSWCDFTGQTRETGLGSGWLAAVHAADRAEVQRVYSLAHERREPVRVEYRFHRHDGEIRWALDVANPRFGPDGSFLGFVGSRMDMTGYRHTDETLRLADRRKDEFLALLAHELRNPLTPIRNSLHIMKLSGVLTPAQQRSHEMIDRQVTHILCLIDGLVDPKMADALVDPKKERKSESGLEEARTSTAGVVADALETAMLADVLERNRS